MATTGPKTRAMLLDQLHFLDAGGYRFQQRVQLFKDSPTCPNHGLAERRVACSECALAAFVPKEDRDEPDCCQLIPLNRDGDTPEVLLNWGTPEERRRYTRMWLLQQIAETAMRDGMTAESKQCSR